jgi:hydrogenase maturation protease
MHPSPARGGTGIRVDSQTMPRILIVAYGNPMRCDDGVAWRAADALERNFCGGDVEILRTHQLAPELAEAISRCEAVIFVDAASPEGGNSQPGEVRCAQVGLSESTPKFSHQLSPGAVVALARQLYGASPLSFSVTLTGCCFDHGESLSPVVAASLPSLVTRIESLVQEFLVPEAPSGPASPGIRRSWFGHATWARVL